MSDEPDPPAFSLRPRKKPAEADAVADTAKTGKPRLTLKPKVTRESAVSTAKTEGEEKPNLSLKPRAKPEEKSTETPVTPAPAEAPVKPRPKPKLSIKTEAQSEVAAEPAPGTGETSQPAQKEKPRLKLNTGPAAEPVQSSGFVGADPAPPALPPPMVPAEPEVPPPPPPLEGEKDEPSLPPPVPVVTNSDGNTAITPPIPSSVDIAEDDEDDETDAPARKRLRPEQRPVFKIAIIVIVAVLLGAIGTGAYMLYDLLFVEPPLPTFNRPVAVAPAQPPAAGPSSTAGKLIEKAQNAAGAHTANVETVDAVVAEEPPETVLPEVMEGPPPPAPSNGDVPPTQPFKDWVAAAVISGVAETSSPRAFINNILVKEGDIVDHGLGITFDTVDPVENLVIFKDDTGAVVGKKY